MYAILTYEELLQFFIAVVNAELFETVAVEHLEAVDVQDADDGHVFVPWRLLLLPHLDGVVDVRYDRAEQPLVYCLWYSFIIIYFHFLNNYEKVK